LSSVAYEAVLVGVYFEEDDPPHATSEQATPQVASHAALRAIRPDDDRRHTFAVPAGALTAA
jgi:hypothetical protein